MTKEQFNSIDLRKQLTDDLKSKCSMKFAVIKLVEKYGKPIKE